MLTMQLGDSVSDAALNDGRLHTLKWAFDANDVSIAHRARYSFVDALRNNGVRGENLNAAELVFGELSGNVVRYAPGPIEIIFDWNEGPPVLHVLDRGPGFTLRAEAAFGSPERARPRTLYRLGTQRRFQRNRTLRRRLARARRARRHVGSIYPASSLSSMKVGQR